MHPGMYPGKNHASHGRRTGGASDTIHATRPRPRAGQGGTFHDDNDVGRESLGG